MLTFRTTLLALALAGSTFAAGAAEVRYTLNQGHTFPIFEADHWGLSTFIGRFERSRGHVTLDRAKGSGTVEVVVDMASVDFGFEPMNEKARSADIFDVAKYPQATYRGTLAGFRDGKPTRVDGTLTLHGVSRPLVLAIERFACKPHPLMAKREFCGADARAEFSRADFGVTAGRDSGFDMKTVLRIQVEALQDEG